MPGACLDRETLRGLLAGSPPLVEGYLDLESQLQPNGFDLTVQEVAGFTTSGALGRDSAGRRLPEATPIAAGPDGWLRLPPGPYRITFREVVHLPLDVMALGKPRSSLLRCGVAVHNAVWDAGYQGRSQALLVVYNPQGFALEENARVVQLVFFRLERPLREGYSGRFQREGL